MLVLFYKSKLYESPTVPGEKDDALFATCIMHGQKCMYERQSKSNLNQRVNPIAPLPRNLNRPTACGK